MNALDVATDGWLSLPLSVATSGYISVTLPASFNLNSILDVEFKSVLPELVFFKVDDELRVTFSNDSGISLGIDSDLTTKTIKFFSESFNLEVENSDEKQITFQSKGTTILRTEDSPLLLIEVKNPTQTY